jgi:hypothetical protein
MAESGDSFYSSAEWIEVRDLVRERDGRRCSVGRLLGGSCRGPLHVHHILSRRERPDLALDQDNLGTVCASHHPMWEALLRLLRILNGDAELPPCGHVHPYREGREACDRKRREQIALRRAEKLARAA